MSDSKYTSDGVATYPNEIWKDIPNYEGLYKASNLGRFKALDKVYYTGENHLSKRVKKEHILKYGNHSDGYLQVVLSSNGKATTFLAHIIIATLFVDNPYNKPEVNHKVGNKLNIEASNLEWSTRSENIQHAYDTGLKKNKKLGEAQRAKVVLDTQTGIFYECAKEAAIAKGINYKTLINKLSGWHKNNYTGLVYV